MKIALKSPPIIHTQSIWSFLHCHISANIAERADNLPTVPEQGKYTLINIILLTLIMLKRSAQVIKY